VIAATHCGHSVLSCSCLCNDAVLAHALAQESLPQGIVDLVGACVVEVLTLEVYLSHAAILPAFDNE